MMEFVSWDDDIHNIWKVIKFHGSKPPTSMGCGYIMGMLWDINSMGYQYDDIYLSYPHDIPMTQNLAGSTHVGWSPCRPKVLRQHQRFEGAEVRQDHVRPGPPDATPSAGKRKGEENLQD